MRLFWAIETSEEGRDRLAAIQEELRQACPGEKVSWPGPEKLHLTLKFLGELPRKTCVEAIVEAARPSLPDAELDLLLSGLGSFGGRPPRVLWAGIEGSGREPLVTLATQLDRAMRPLGFPREKRPFSPHITLGRVRASRRGRGGPRPPSRLKPALAALNLEPIPFTAGELVLFESSFGQGKGPPVYSPLARLRFGVP